MTQVVSRAIGGTAFFAAGYWAIFQKDEPKVDRKLTSATGVRSQGAEEHPTNQARATSFLIGSLLIQLVLALFYVLDAEDTLVFRVLYGMYMLALVGTVFSAVAGLRTRARQKRPNERQAGA